ncbi:MAG: hypothetical protein M3319_00950 [Actinomycetota bacterium]|nr:hypothetical protein [Actinomycetota bacterium]
MDRSALPPESSAKTALAGLSAGQYASFVVRVWGRGGDLVQGQITHTATRRTVRFRTPQSMLAFIVAHLGAPQGDAAVESNADER